MTERTNQTVRVMTGNEAVAEAAVAAGVRFFAGYPITPSSEIAEILSGLLPRVKGNWDIAVGATAQIIPDRVGLPRPDGLGLHSRES